MTEQTMTAASSPAPASLQEALVVLLIASARADGSVSLHEANQIEHMVAGMKLFRGVNYETRQRVFTGASERVAEHGAATVTRGSGHGAEGTRRDRARRGRRPDAVRRTHQYQRAGVRQHTERASECRLRDRRTNCRCAHDQERRLNTGVRWRARGSPNEISQQQRHEAVRSRAGLRRHDRAQ